jgi:hypothetical protein
MNDKPADLEEALDASATTPLSYELTTLIAAIQRIYEMSVALRDGDEMTFKIAFKNRRGKLVSHVKLVMEDRVRAYLKPIAEAEADSEVLS